MNQYKQIPPHDIDKLLRHRTYFQRQKKRIFSDPNKDSQLADIVTEIDQLDNILLANIPQAVHTQINQFTK